MSEFLNFCVNVKTTDAVGNTAEKRNITVARLNTPLAAVIATEHRGKLVLDVDLSKYTITIENNQIVIGS